MLCFEIKKIILVKNCQSKNFFLSDNIKKCLLSCDSWSLISNIEKHSWISLKSDKKYFFWTQNLLTLSENSIRTSTWMAVRPGFVYQYWRRDPWYCWHIEKSLARGTRRSIHPVRHFQQSSQDFLKTRTNQLKDWYLWTASSPHIKIRCTGRVSPQKTW